jgi:DNA-directed RNA polymerase specialized sigma24 family protein
MDFEERHLDLMLKAYREKQIDRKQLEGSIFTYIRQHLSRFNLDRLNRDVCGDFISWLYPRLSRAIDRYRDKGSSFDAYIGALVRLSVKEYNQRQKNHRIVERTWWTAKAEEAMICEEEEPEYFEPDKVFEPVSNPRQVLILLLKSYYYLSDDFLKRIAPTLGMEQDELSRMVDELRKQRLTSEIAIRRLQERIHSQFYRCLTFEKRMRASVYQPAYYDRMKKSLELAKRRLHSMRKRLATMRFKASNRQVAEVLNIAKGTVDSNLHAVKRQLKNNTENQ